MRPEVNKFRVRDGLLASTDDDGFNGFFCLYIKDKRVKVIASDGMGWKHVSVSLHDTPNKPPTWDIMCSVKNLFWDEEDTVVQYHPAKKDYVNFHKGCLHLWQPLNEKLPTPPPMMVDPQTT